MSLGLAILAAMSLFCGKESVPIEKCRVSAMPFNRVWTGEQRDLSQTMEAYFASFEVVGRGELKILGVPETSGAVLYPLTEGGRLQKAGSVWRLKVDAGAQYVVEFDGLPPLHVFADRPFEYRHVENEIYFGPGEHEAGIIAPTNGQTVCIDRGATVHGEIFLDRVTNVVITGRGILDCSRFERADRRAQEFRKARKLPPIDTEHACHPFVVYASDRVRIEGIVIRDTPFWALLVRSGSTNVEIDGVKIVGQWRYNSDGIDISASSDVTVKDCFVRSFDDCAVVLGAYLDERSCHARRIRFENCRLWCDWGANFKLWSPSYTNTFSEVSMRRCKFLKVCGSPFQIKDTCGSADTRIGELSFENIEIDTPIPPIAGVIQTSDEMKYPGDKPMDSLTLALVSCQAPKRDLGNQKFVPVENPVGYHSAISNVVFRNIALPCQNVKLFARLETAIEGQSVSDVKFLKCPPIEIKQKGNVK